MARNSVTTFQTNVGMASSHAYVNHFIRTFAQI